MANKQLISDEIQSKRVDALNRCMDRFKLTNKDLSNSGCGAPGEITYFRQGKRTLTDYVVDRIYDNVFKEKGVLKSYLLGDCSFMTQIECDNVLSEYRESIKVDPEYLTKHISMADSCENVIMYALNEVCKKEGIEVPDTSNPEFNFLCLQLQDEAQKLVWAYLHQDTTPLWSFITKFHPLSDNKMRKCDSID